jgi:hypothetical protein
MTVRTEGRERGRERGETRVVDHGIVDDIHILREVCLSNKRPRGGDGAVGEMRIDRFEPSSEIASVRTAEGDDLWRSEEGGREEGGTLLLSVFFICLTKAMMRARSARPCSAERYPRFSRLMSVVG